MTESQAELKTIKLNQDELSKINLQIVEIQTKTNEKFPN